MTCSLITNRDPTGIRPPVATKKASPPFRRAGIGAKGERLPFTSNRVPGPFTPYPSRAETQKGGMSRAEATDACRNTAVGSEKGTDSTLRGRMQPSMAAFMPENVISAGLMGF